MIDLQELLAALIRCESVTPHDADCQQILINHLEKLGFSCQRFNNGPVANFFARHGNSPPLLVFAGHTDVVPVGDANKWLTPPFQLSNKDGFFYGRGTADMKGSLACMLLAVEHFLKNHSVWTGSIGFLITSAEEGDDFALGTPYVMQELERQNIAIDYCIVGEPSSSKRVGDVIKIGRRGSLSGQLLLQGKQGHVAYPHLASNPIHNFALALAELTARRWDSGNDYFPPTSFQITHIQSGGHAGNIIPGELAMHFNFRFSTEQTAEILKKEVTDCLMKHGLDAKITWKLNGEPFLTNQGTLLKSTIAAIEECCGQEPELSTSGGTSDGRFIAPYGVEVLELGPCNATIHQVNECVKEQDLVDLIDIYYSLCSKVFYK